MRFLKVDANYNFRLTEYRADNERFKYAILSHTWGKDNDEVTYEDLLQGTGKDKVGYQKIAFCAKQAISDRIQYIWIDTCCIDKLNNSVELEHAINSMFRWYKRAEKCYVYLEDVPDRRVDAGDQTLWELSLQNSRWFTRGWTLQELIAPAIVEFYSTNWGSLGSKASLERQICGITGIPVEALRGSPLEGFSIVERMSWAEKRQTKFEEDLVYSLLGLFGVSLCHNYGETKAYALQRLNDEIKRVHKGMFLSTHFITSQY
jgi:hypothetical protein